MTLRFALFLELVSGFEEEDAIHLRVHEHRPGAANQRSKCLVHAPNSTCGGAPMTRSTVKWNGRAERSGRVTGWIMICSMWNEDGLP